MSDTKEKIKDGINDAATKAKQATEEVMQMTSDIRGHAENVVDQTRQCYEHVAERAHEEFRKARALVRENPSLAVSTAFGIGVGMGIGVVIGLSLGTGRAWR